MGSVVCFSVFPCGSSDNAATLRNLFNKYANNPSQFHYDGRPLVSTFSGETCTFGQGSAAQGWKSQFVDLPVSKIHRDHSLHRCVKLPHMSKSVAEFSPG